MYECKIAEKLTELRNAKGVTQDDVAQALGISNKTVSKWENGASMPDLTMLALLAKYYGVSTDNLLGLADTEKKSFRENIRSEFEGLERKNAFLKAFEAARLSIPPIFDILKKEDALYEISTEPLHAYPAPQKPRNRIATQEFFTFTVNSEDVNAAVMLLRNQSDFAWLTDPEKQEKITKLFKLLSDGEALCVLYFMNSVSCSVNFTADYIADQTGLKEEIVEKILDDCCKLGICTSLVAHLTEKDVTLYEFYGDGMLLAILSLALEKTCGKDIYNYNFNGYSKMIGGK